MVHGKFSACQQIVFAGANNAGMNPWEIINAELKRRKLGWKWLADRLEVSIQRVQNWKTRGVPARHYRAIAEVLQTLTIDEIEGVTADKADDDSGLTPRHQAFIDLIDSLPQSEQDDLMQSLEEKKQHYEKIISEFLARRKG